MKTPMTTRKHKFLNQYNSVAAIGLATTLLVSTQTLAAPTATFSNFTYSGTGCPAGSATPSIQAPGGNQLIVDFTQFNIPFNSPPANQMKSCVLSAKITPSAGFKVSVQPAIYQGTVGKQTIGLLSAGHSFGSFQTPRFTETYKGPFTFGKMHSGAVPYTICPDSAILQDDIKLTVSPGDPATGGVRKVTYTLQFQPC